MKTIVGLNEKIYNFEDLPSDAPLPTIKRLFLMVLGASQAKDGEESISIYDIGLKIKNAGDNVELENADFELLKKLSEANAPKLLAFYHAQILMKLKKAEASNYEPV